MNDIEKAVRKAKKIVKDPRHGYDNRPGHRTGPDYACSSFVAKCYSHTGVPLNSYTATMKKQWKEFGFKDVADKVNLRTGAGLKRGDIVIAPSKHTAMVINTASHKLAEAVGNPRGGASHGAQGDQGGEIRIHKWYDDGWTQCLRLKQVTQLVTQTVADD